MSNEGIDKGTDMNTSDTDKGMKNDTNGCDCRECNPRGLSRVRWIFVLIAALSSAMNSGSEFSKGSEVWGTAWILVAVAFAMTLREGRKP